MYIFVYMFNIIYIIRRVIKKKKKKKKKYIYIYILYRIKQIK